MSKLAIFFCIICFVSAANTGVFSVPTTNPELKNEKVKVKISEIQRKSRDNDRIAEKLSNLATEFSLKIREEIWFLSRKVKADIKQLIDQAKGPGISRCANFKHLNNIATNITLETSQCVANKLRTGHNQVVDVDKLLKNANSEKKIEKIPISQEFDEKTAILHKFLQETYQPCLNNCLNNGLDDFRAKSPAVVKKTTECIRKIRSFTKH